MLLYCCSLAQHGFHRRFPRFKEGSFVSFVVFASVLNQKSSSGIVSPFLDETVTDVTGIVTAVDSNAFYVQDPNGDGNEATSDALVVFTNRDPPNVQVGDLVSVNGTVSEFTPGGTATRNLSTTQISDPSVAILSSGNALPSPILLGVSGRNPPTESMEDAVTFFESMEAMLVTVVEPRCIAGTNRFGELFAVVDGGRGATGLSSRGTLNIAPDDFNPEKVQIDTDNTISGDIEIPMVDVGAILSNVTGVIGYVLLLNAFDECLTRICARYAFGNFEVIPTEAFEVVTESTIEPTTTGYVGDSSTLLIGSYNVLNLDINDNDGDTDVADGRIEENANIIAVHMNGPDIVGLQEVQDDSGSEDDGVVSASATLGALVAAITAIDPSMSYEFIDNPCIGNNTSGGQPGGNIRTAFLYNPMRVSVDADSINCIVDPIDQQSNSENPFFDSRIPLVATFTFLSTGYKYEVINNHWSSKGGSAPIVGTVQPFEDLQEDSDVNGSLDERQAQSAAIKSYIGTKENVIVVGDFNEFEFISPIEGLAPELTILTIDIPETERYSFIFQGNSQSLDHILVSKGIEATAEYVHVNSEFAETSGRASDHDPMVALIQVPVPASDTGTSRSIRRHDALAAIVVTVLGGILVHGV